jgi:hypothetical protein
MDINGINGINGIKELSQEIKDDTVILIFGRFQPFSLGHIAMFEQLKDLLASGYSKYYVGTSAVQENQHLKTISKQAMKNITTSQSLVEHENRKNPLTTREKVKFIKLGMKSEGLDSRRVFVSSDPLGAFYKMRTKAKRLIIICGEDRVDSYRRILVQNEKKEEDRLDFEDYKILSGSRDRGTVANPLLGVSATVVRTLAVINDFDEFRKKVPYLDENHQRKLFKILRKAYLNMIGVNADLGMETGTGTRANLIHGDISNTSDTLAVPVSLSSPSPYSISSNAKAKTVKK